MRTKLATLALAAILPFTAVQAAEDSKQAQGEMRKQRADNSLSLTPEQREQMQQLREKHSQEMRDVLTPAQQERFDQKMQQRQSKFGNQQRGDSRYNKQDMRKDFKDGRRNERPQGRRDNRPQRQ